MDTNKPIRINKFLSSLGTYSRRQVDKLIEEKRIRVNKKYAKLGIRVSTSDEITIDGELILIKSKKKKPVYLILNKPIGIECTTNLNVNNNIIDFLGYPKRIFPVGRLDKDSEGIIFLTNDGDIVNKILRSENNNEKEYEVRVNKKINSDFLNQMSGGVKIKNVTTNPCKIEKINNYTFKIILTQGLNRQIRKMCRHFNYKVKNLKRTRIINISLGSLKIGKFRKFTPYELESLMDHL